MTLFSQKLSLPVGHEKTTQTSGELLAPAISNPLNVSLISKSIMSVPASEKTPGPTHNGFPYASSLIADDIAYIKTGCGLRARYPAEGHSHKNMKRRAKEHGKTVSPVIADFRDFLLLIGPMPAPGMTLDRIDNDDPEYAPGKVRWATKKVQNNNKGDTRIYTLSVNGMKFTASQIAEHFGLTTDAVRKRSERGWSDDEIIEGKRRREVATVGDPATRKPAASCTPMTGREREVELLLKKENAPTAKEKAYWDMALSYEQHRRIDGEEAFPAPLEVLNEGIADLGLIVTPEQYERKIRKWWPEHRPHVDFGRLPLSQKELIAVIDPEYVARWEERAQRRQQIADQL